MIRVISLSLANVGVNGVVALVTVPVFIYAVGGSQYAGWIALSAVPALLVMSDLGLVAAGATQFTHFATMRHAESLSFYRAVTLMALVQSASVCGLVGVALAILGGPLYSSTISWVLICTAWLAVVSNVVESGFRGIDLFHVGLSWLLCVRIVESAGLFVGVLLWRDLLVGCILQMSLKFVVLCAMTSDFRRRLTGADLVKGSSLRPVELLPTWRGLAGASLGSLLGPLSQAALLQGIVVIAASKLSPGALVVFNASRLLVGVARQLGLSAIGATIPRMTRTHASDQEGLFRLLSLRVLIATTVIGAIFGLALTLAGGAGVSALTGLEVENSSLIFAGLSFWVLCELLWAALAVELVARNEHTIRMSVHVGMVCLFLLAVWSTEVDTVSGFSAAMSIFGAFLLGVGASFEVMRRGKRDAVRP